MPAAVLLFQTFGPGSFGAGREALPQLLGMLSWAVLAWAGRRDLADPLGLGEGRESNLNTERLGWFTAVGWLPASLALWSAVRFPESSSLRLAGGVILATLAVAGVRRLVARSPRLARDALLLVVGLVAGSAAALAFSSGGTPAMPLGHHNLLVLWLVAWLPLLGVQARAQLAKSPSSEGGLERPESPRRRSAGLARVSRMALSARPWASRLIVVVLVGVVVATRSLTGALTLLMLACLAAGAAALHARRQARSAGRGASHSAGGRRRPLAATGALAGLVVLLALALAIPRVTTMVQGRDASASARALYLRAGADAFAHRPTLGWGLGRGGFGIQRSLPAAPGERVAGQLVSDAHTLWFDLLVEVGWIGGLLLLSVLVCVIRRILTGLHSWRARERLPEADADGSRGLPASVTIRELQIAGVVGLAVLAFTGGFAGWFDVGALWLTLVLLVALALGPRVSSELAAPPRRGAVAGALLVLALLLQAPDLQSRYAAARAEEMSSGQVRRALLVRAARGGTSLDRLRLGIEDLLELDSHSDAGRARAERLSPSPTSREALFEAARASGLWFAWTLAGEAAWRAGEWERARMAWRLACDQEPMAPFAALRLAQTEESGALAVDALARALVADPRVAGADLPEPLLWQTVDVLSNHSALPAGWRQTLLDARREAGILQAPRASSGAIGSVDRTRTEARGALALQVDREGETSVSLFFYRRAPRPRTVPLIEVDLAIAELFAFEPAARLRETNPELWLDGCRLGPTLE